MELYAGMMDNLDHNIGRLINCLKEIGKYEHTLILFLSDNGAAGEDFYCRDGFKELLQANFTDSYDDMGKPNSFISYGPQWAEASSVPFKYYKSFSIEGGMTVPMIASGPRVNAPNCINDFFFTVLNLAPTIYELTDTAYPKEWNGKPSQPLLGASLVPVLEGTTTSIHTDDYVFGFEQSGMAMLRKGKWKITNTEKPFAIGNFQLYNLSADLGEQKDLSKSNTEKYQEMFTEWRNWTQKVGVIFPTLKHLIQNNIL